MRTLSESLLRGQRAKTILAKNLLMKCVLTYGTNEYEYTKTLIKKLAYTRQFFSNRAELVIEDSSKTLHGIDLEGYKAVISYGLVTRSGPEWIATAPFWVYGQQRDSYRKGLECSLSLEGIFDRMAKHKADGSYTVESGDTRTIKDWLTEIISLTDPDSSTNVTQDTSDSDLTLRSGVRYYGGQRLTITDRTITKLAFKLKKVGNPTGPVTFSINSVDPDDEDLGGEVLARQLWGDAFSLGTDYDWVEVTFDAPVHLTGANDVRICADFQDGDANNYVLFAYNASSVAASEQLTELYLTTWTDQATYDAVYRYSYSATPVTVYDDYPAYGLVFDEEDDLIDTFIPADSFRINLNDTRLRKVKELLSYTDCVAVVKNDGLIHILVPTTSGTTYDYEYSLAAGQDYHNFFNKRFRRRIVSPNYIIFKDYDGTYTGFASDASADLKDMKEIETKTVRATSNAQCTNLATAYLSKLQLAAEKGSAVIPFMNFGQEIYDYVNVVDARAGDNRAANVGFISLFYEPGQFSMNFGFGSLPLGVRPLEGYSSEADMSLAQIKPLLFQLQDYILMALQYAEENQENIKIVDENFRNFLLDGDMIKLRVHHRFREPFGTAMWG